MTRSRSTHPLAVTVTVAAFGVMLSMPADAVDCACDVFSGAGPGAALRAERTDGGPGNAGEFEHAGTSGHTHAVDARVHSPDGMAIHAHNLATEGWAIGVEGDSLSETGVGVYGWHAGAGAGFGVYGSTGAGSGVGAYGGATATSGQSYGMKGETASSQGRAIGAFANAAIGQTYGLYAQTRSSAGRAVYGMALSGAGTVYGVYGQTNSINGRAVYGDATASTGTTYGVYGRAASSAGYAVYASGNLTATGVKAATVATSAGPTEMYAVESAEVWFEDIGGGRLKGGRARVDLDPHFLETVTVDDENPLRVFVQLRGDARGVYVVEGQEGFDVIELSGGRSDAPFSYRVMAKRRGYEDVRMRPADVVVDDFMTDVPYAGPLSR